MVHIKLSKRHLEILRLVREEGPMTGEDIAARFNLTRATLRPDLTILTMTGLMDARPRVGYFYSGSKGRSFVAEQLDTIPIRQIKALPVVIETGQSAYEAVVNLFLEDQGTLFVVNSSGLLEGVISRKDLLKVSLGNSDLNSIPVELVMTRFAQTIWIEERDTVLGGIKKLQDSQVNCLPVLKSADSRIPTGRFDLNIVLKLLGEMIQGDFEEGLYNE